MPSVVGVKYISSTKVYHFETPEFSVKVGDKVVVDTINGPAVGTIQFTAREVESVEGELKKVVRIATEKDLNRIKALEEKAKNQIPLIEEKIKNLNLDMNVTSAEYSFDETKITISFTSEGRVDFRELLKVLAYSLKCNIELRQIGARDEVIKVGGLGLCGSECCCTRFLKEPTHTNVKMAKLQGLSLNPAKTGGLCGRMMCCLAYEDPVYRELSKDMPEVGKKIMTPDGEGVVTYNDILGQTVTIRIYSGENNYKQKEYPLNVLLGKTAEPQTAEEPKMQKIEEPKRAEINQAENKAEVETQENKKNNRHKKHRFNFKKRGEKQ